MKQQNPLESPPVEPDAIVLKECLCFGGKIGAGCQGCVRREETVSAYVDECPEKKVVDAAKYQSVCLDCGSMFSTREGVQDFCTECHHKQ